MKLEDISATMFSHRSTNISRLYLYQSSKIVMLREGEYRVVIVGLGKEEIGSCHLTGIKFQLYEIISRDLLYSTVPIVNITGPYV